MRKKFIKTILLINFFIIFFNLTTLNVFATCDSFKNDLKELQYRYVPESEHENFGFDLLQIYNPETKYKRS